jgi:hypothetical protein
MTAWHENARFNIFTECDVYIEDDHYLYVENQAFDYYGDYVCRECHIIDDPTGNTAFMWHDAVGADNDYICGFDNVDGLEKAPWNIARKIINSYLVRWQSIEETLDKYHSENEKKAPLIEDARWYLMHDATEDEVFTYC